MSVDADRSDAAPPDTEAGRVNGGVAGPRQRHHRASERFGHLPGPVAVAVLALAVAQLLRLWDRSGFGAADASFIDDLDRDLIGVAAIERGVVPYAPIGRLWDGAPAGVAGLWVTHTPFTLAGVRLFHALVGDAGIGVTARLVGLTAVVLLALALSATVRQGLSTRLALAGLTIAWAVTQQDWVWIQWNAVAGLGVLAVFLLDRSRRRWIALVSLGVLVGWKPWLAPLAVVLPRSVDGYRDGTATALTAFGANMLVLPFVGGWATFSAWVTRTLPGNFAEVFGDRDVSLSLAAVLPPAAGAALYLGVIGILPLVRRRMPRSVWPVAGALVTLALSPIVWSHYWLGLLPALLWPLVGHQGGSFRVVALAAMSLFLFPYVAMGLGLSPSGIGPLRWASWAAAALLLVGLASEWRRLARDDKVLTGLAASADATP